MGVRQRRTVVVDREFRFPIIILLALFWHH